MKQTIPKHSSVTDLERKLCEVQQDLDLIVRSGRWLVWSCIVSGPFKTKPPWIWSFRPDISTVFPDWFDIDMSSGWNLTTAIRRARLPDDQVLCDDLADQALRTGAPGYTQMFRIRLRDGRVSWIEENVTIQALPDGTWHLVGICIDATARKNAEERLQALQEELIARNDELQAMGKRLEKEKRALAEANARLATLATTDGLTGIKNHRAFQEELEKEWESALRYNQPLSLVLFDIDHFKPYNDSFGHPAGDQVLRQIGRILHDTARGCDFLARYGGEEFVVVLPQADKAGSIALAERFRSCIAAWPWEHRKITASFGVATLSPKIPNPLSLIDQADRALYQAKLDGRNCVRHAGNLPALAAKS